MQDQRAELDWRQGDVPVSRRFDDPYFSLDDGLAETGHVFLQGNDLPARFRDGFAVAELGFGTGLNMLACAEQWAAHGAPGTLHLTSFEAYPMEAADMTRALAVFPQLRARAAPLIEAWQDGRYEIDLGDGVKLTVIIGDARETLPRWPGRADAWFLDGFSPARNPELWEPDLLNAVFAHTAPGGTAATYSAAGHVRRALKDAGFAVERAPGHGRKRHMTRARMPE
ncbi:tRNA U34 5-methylaminomethyl-2-thiouridine-forming methyltransferase MnmC [Roseovarius nanhaiticus]|uniref:tRNA U34 5-methylaminomethyl-2-thiouridine-forming methyltransferase MnmC n=1 Tax=Roseovarius nanhaiticus TaxID=573024 RepID=A0A1N7H2M7_9RHOB|nr:tRNA (5-methylaminomethyl-2-thiouridine)(34)-methyltransferase MnmD [Roseovarius nanhaiticus]SEL15247.1 tRNA U34 5-methylaminomethyl-2-thiouridine-forming methyltransferase MnmC [Roseovarius nanhaiticus]SIS19089.1 tRNA U34 5-methylaminomethyl-2-thiouridine-forming methyltransferase MnmC [Roseovarius nanhaiticus]